MCYLSMMKYYSAIKKNRLESLIGKWIHLEAIILSVINKAHKLI